LGGHLEESIKTFEQVERLEPENIDILNSLAAVTLKAGKLDEALAYVKRVLREDNENITALNTLGQIYMAKDNRSMAKYVFRKAIRVSIGAITNDEEAQAEPALLVMEDKINATDLDRELTADLLNNLGLIYMREDEVPLAVVNFTAAGKLDRADVESRLNLGALFLRYLNYDGSKTAFRTALNSAPDNCTAVLGLAASQFALGEREESQVGYHSYLESCDGKSASAHLQLERIYERRQDFPNAIVHCQRYVALVENPPKDDPMTADYCKALENMATMSREAPMDGMEELPPEDGMEELPPEDGMEELPPEDGAAPEESDKEADEADGESDGDGKAPAEGEGPSEGDDGSDEGGDAAEGDGAGEG
jgi:tetratricopeptide (TPR) repeat protein